VPILLFYAVITEIIRNFAGEMDTEEMLDIASQLRALAGRLEALAAAEPADVPEELPAEKPAAEEPAEPAISFALNDRYRFLRELFGGSAEAMAEAVGVIAGLQSAEEVESYLIGHGFDTASETVKDFLHATTRRFDSHPPLLG